MRKWYGFVAFIGYVASVCAICAAPAPAAAEQNPPRFAFSVDRAGLVSLPLAALPAAADPAMLHVRRRGQEIAVQISTGAIQFVAAAGEGPYTRAASYTIGEEATPGARAPLPALIAAPLAWERDELYQPAARSDRGDRWFAGELRGGAPPLTATLTLPYALAAGTEIELHLAPLARRDGHRVELSLAGAPAGAAYWDDDSSGAAVTATLRLTQALPAGAAELSLALASAGAPEDAVLLDRIVLPGALAPLPMLPTPTLRAVAAHDLRDGPAPGRRGASFLIVAHPALREALAPLVQAHAARGDSVALLDVGDVYDSFSDGERDPAAIRALVRAALAGWSPAPRALLLVGAGSVRMRADAAGDPTLIPPFLLEADPKYGEVACDSCFARVAPDVRAQLVPSIAVGRLPARTADEARLLVAKAVAALSAQPPGLWRGRALALADNAYEADGTADRAGNFVAVAERALALLPHLRPERFFYAPERAAAAPFYHEPEPLRRALFGALDQGAALLLYVGHASRWQWAFTSADAPTPYLASIYDADARVNGARLPILLSMDCLSGDWANPQAPSIDERLLLAARGGVAAALTPAGSGVNTGHERLLAGALPALAAGRSLGEAELAGMAALARSGRDADLLFSYSLLGDPDTRLPDAWPGVYIPLVRR